ncbi:SpvB/TcaC N-terminal domain-containing protein [Amycolatopsis azurea]|uniref:Insecticidal toxin complex protein n=1 Tax=Amycolatopsis azurea DSM 43854 TaxID=1238180 RepID=M2QT88_9PSEU|nr:SpvB/TcaC N-terminal domain-containing protein [Amycolatopsis azurea]EMD29227.1 insecticidal toxin complex protein [Amycolatopsis azurea DSM 43854]OOC02004.1 sugar-binding protein [Amycolatopsis azurea DSM 43854]
MAQESRHVPTPEVQPTGPATSSPGDSGSPAPGVPIAPSVSVPKGGGAIRGIGEKFSANPATGTGSLTVPLEASPGRNGFGPALELGYDSGSGNGPFGLGWRLGLPSVTRKTDKGLPTYREGAAKDSEDTFLLSGAEDLVPVLTASGVAETYHRDEDGRGFTVRRYRPRIEGLFARIEWWTAVDTGETHWRSISRDDVTTFYGRTAESRIADPRDPLRVFSWLICASHDAVGNEVHYGYKAEDAVGVDFRASHERNRDAAARTVQRYLKRIRYGNRVPGETHDVGWHFEVVFDYGEHDADNPTPVEDRPWSARLDPFSGYRAGFEVRDYRLCRRVLMFHHFPDEPGVGRDCLVRATELRYRGDAVRGEQVLSVLGSVVRHGFRRTDGGYVKRSLPPLELDYSEAVIDTCVHALDRDALANVPVGLGEPAYRWVDLDGDGRSGILTEQAGAWFYKPNLGDGRFGPLQTTRRPTEAALNGGRQQLLDLAGDGSLDLVEFGGRTPGFTERTVDHGWGLFRAFTARPDLDWNDANLRFVDLNGDGHVDVLLTGEQAFTWYRSLGEDGFDLAGRTFVPDDEEAGPRLIFAEESQSIHFADMSGDGLTDLVRVRNGEICYWPNLGYGRFGAKVAMDDAPWLDDTAQFDPARLRLADVDGSGTTDLIYLHPRGTRLYRNQSGNSWSAARDLGVSFPRVDNVTQVSVVDLLGTGTACLVWSSPLPGDATRPLKFLDLMGGVKPHLLISARNNLGVETHVSYAPSTRFSAADRMAGRPWGTRLPFPVQVVERVDTVDLVGRNRFTTVYAYHHGHFDGVEREFRGFGMVEQRDTEQLAVLGHDDLLPDAANLGAESHVPPVLTRTWFHTGAFLDEHRISRQYAHEYFPDTLPLPDSVVPPGLTADEARQARRALKGLPLRQEVYALDGSAAEGKPYLVTEHNYTVELLQRALQRTPDNEGLRHAVFLATPRETLTAHHERQADPRIGHELVLDIDTFGNVLRSATVAYGRREPDAALTAADQDKQRRLHVVVTENDFTNVVDGPDDHRLPQRCETRAFEVLGVSPTKDLFSLTELRAELDAVRVELPYENQDPEPGPAGRRMIEHNRTLFRRDDLTGPLPLGVLEALALPFESYRQAFTTGLVTQLYGDRVDTNVLADAGYVQIDGGWWIPSGRIRYSPGPDDDPVEERDFARRHFFLPRRFRDPFGGVTTVAYDRYDLLVTGSTDAVGNVTTVGERDADGRILGNGNDYRVLQPRLVTDANRNRAEVAHDAHGRVAGTAVMGKREEQLGDSLDGFRADLDRTEIDRYFADPLEDPGGLLGDASTRVIYDELAFWHTLDDASPRPCATATLARETHLSELMPGERGRIRHHLSFSDGFGREVQQKAQAEPGPDGAARWVGSGWTIFNNKGKPVRTYEPFFTATPRFEFAKIAGVSSVLFYDPMDRVIITLQPDSTYLKTLFGPWHQETWDSNDTVLHHPGEDQDTAGYVRRHLAGIGGWTTWYARRVHGDLGPAEQHAAEQAAIHAATPARAGFDTLGRTFLSLEHNRFLRDGSPVDELYPTRSELDIEGNEREVRDALGRVVMRYGHDMLGSRVLRSGMDTGGGPVLLDVLGKPRYSWNSRGFRFRTEYDSLRRPVRSYLSGPGLAGELLHQCTEYGEVRPDAEAKNLRGQVVRQFDDAGVSTYEGYDFKGNLLDAGRQLAAGYRELPDWNGQVPLEDQVFAGHTRYDALNRPTSMTTPDGSVIRSSYNEASLLERLDAELRDSGEVTTFVTNLDYNARGQRLAVELGNGAETVYEYDPLTFRMTRLRTRRGAERLQNLTYTFDPVGNVTGLRDDAQQTVFFRNRVVDPSASYTYDAVYRLISATGREHLGQTAPDSTDAPRAGLSHPGDGAAMAHYVQRYVYDAVGNILRMAHRAGDAGWTRDYTYAEPSLLEPGHVSNRLSHTTSDGEVATPPAFGYDEQGNITAMPELPSMRWDPQDRLQATSRQALGNGTPETTYYVYDATGQRVRKVTELAGETPRRKAERIYLGSFEVYREYGGDDQVSLERETLHILDDKQRVALVETRTLGTDEGAETLLRYQLANHLGSAVLELDDAGRVISYEEYHPYGSTAYQAVRSATEAPKRYRYTGKERDSETGLYYHGARYYLPWLGRWTAADPIGLGDGINVYAYCHDDPTGRNDPQGTDDNSTLAPPAPQGFGLTFGGGQGIRIGPLSPSPGQCDELNPRCRGFTLGPNNNDNSSGFGTAGTAGLGTNLVTRNPAGFTLPVPNSYDEEKLAAYREGVINREVGVNPDPPPVQRTQRAAGGAASRAFRVTTPQPTAPAPGGMGYQADHILEIQHDLTGQSGRSIDDYRWQDGRQNVTEGSQSRVLKQGLPQGEPAGGVARAAEARNLTNLEGFRTGVRSAGVGLMFAGPALTAWSASNTDNSTVRATGYAAAAGEAGGAAYYGYGRWLLGAGTPAGRVAMSAGGAAAGIAGGIGQAVLSGYQAYEEFRRGDNVAGSIDAAASIGGVMLAIGVATGGTGLVVAGVALGLFALGFHLGRWGGLW